MTIPKEKIIEVAKKAGFDSELKMASLLAKSGWQINQNVYYIDKDEEKGRELDIHAYKIFSATDRKPETNCHINLCIEVKKTSEPFIFFTNPPQFFETGGGYGLFNWKQNIDRHVLSYEDIEKVRPESTLKRIARSYCSLKDGKTQQIKSGILSAVKAAVHQTEECDESYSDESHDICFFIPIVIIDGPLYECFFTEDAQELTAQESEVIVYKQNYLSAYYGKISQQVLIIRSDAFLKHLIEQENWGNHLLESIMDKKHRYKGRSA